MFHAPSIVGSLLFVSSVAHAETWTVVNLRPPGSDLGQVYSVHGSQQAGIASFNGIRAGFWNGSAGSWVDLDGGAFTFGSSAEAVHGGQVVGSVGDVDEKGDDFSRAALWNGSAAGYVDLHPALPGVTQSNAHAVWGGVQGGEVRYFGTQNRATIWSGTASSIVDLHPPAAADSYVLGMWDGMQVGYATGLPFSHACVWQSTPASFVDLHPFHTGADGSQGAGTDGVQQVGWIFFLSGNVVDHPAVWTGTAASVVDLLPTGWRDGKALDVHEGRQIGYARSALRQEYRALLWNGAADDYVDLHSYLPTGQYIRSTGYGVWNDGVNWYAVGQGVRPGFTSDPLMWIAPITAMPCVEDLDASGDVGFGDILALIANWGVCGACPEDLNGNGQVDFADVLAVIAAWGECSGG